MFIPLDEDLTLSLLENETPCFTSDTKTFVDADCPNCGSMTIPKINLSKPFKGVKINYELVCSKCYTRVNPDTLAIIS